MQAQLETEYKIRLTIEHGDALGGVLTLGVHIDLDVPTRMTLKVVRMIVRRPEVEQWLREQLEDLALSPHVKITPLGVNMRWIRATPIEGTTNRMLVQLFGASNAQDAAALANSLPIKVY